MNRHDLTLINELSIRLNVQAYVHLNIDTGMGRVGIFSSQIDELILLMESCGNVNFEGIYSHFSTSDSKDKTFAHTQLEHFKEIMNIFKQNGIMFPMVHMANSGAILS